MIVQSIILPNQICNTEEIFVRKNGNIRFADDQINMDADSKLKFDTYMNIFDADIWGRYTNVFQWKVNMELCGEGEIRLIRWCGENREILSRYDFQADEWTACSIRFRHNRTKSMYYLEADAVSEVKIKNITFEVDQKKDRNPNVPKLGLIICTYHREQALYRNLKTICDSEFFDSKSDLYGKLYVYIVDNASELPGMDQYHIRLYHNENTGGSGGFTRGIEEIRREQRKTEISNVIFMDDDVELLAETLYRLYALLSIADGEYYDSVVAGRMFRLDQREIQYTAAEIWNKGYIRHVGWNTDMSSTDHLLQMNDNDGAEYGGWWFCCFPMQFVMENDPVQFFIHCDDVEYGLRYGKKPIILNGIQVWHETYEKRQSPVMAYYDTRNPMIVNAMHGLFEKEDDYMNFWRNSMGRFHAKGDYLSEFMAIKAMKDFVTGVGKISEKSTCVKIPGVFVWNRGLRIFNAICWRIINIVLKTGFSGTIKKYNSYLNKEQG